MLTADGMHFVQSRLARLCLEVAGSGPPLLFVGGTGWDLRAPPHPLQSLLTDQFTVALYDQRGMGRSDKPDGPYSMRDYADDAIAVADSLGWERPHLVGYSFGGMVAQEIAINYPDRVNGLVLAASSPGGAGGGSYPIHQLLDLAPYERAKRGLEIADLRFTQAFQRDHPDVAEAMIEQRMRTQTQFADEPRARLGLREQLSARAHHDCFSRLSAITARTLVMAGESDGQAPMEGLMNLADAIQGARFKRVPGAHNFLFEDDRAYREIAAFLDEAPHMIAPENKSA